MILPRMQDLRALGSRPRVHPNGFVQLDLDGRRRVHAWHPDLIGRCQESRHPIHNHAFSFESVVFSGRLLNVTYDAVVVDVGEYVKYRGQKIAAEETILAPDEWGFRYRLTVAKAQMVMPGWSYFMSDDVLLHESLSPDPSVPVLTVMTKQLIRDNYSPTVMVPVGVEPDNNFQRERFEEEELWRMIEDAMPIKPWAYSA